MTDKETVLAKYPKAYSSNHSMRGGWVIYWKPNHTRILGTGVTEAEAWADAAKRVREAK